MNIYDKEQINCSNCGKFIGELDVGSSMIFTLCAKCTKKEKHTIRNGVSSILVPVDLTKKSTRALDTAIYLAKHLGSSVTVMQVIPEINFGRSLLLKDIFKELQDTAESSINYAKAYCDNKNIKTKQIIVKGDEAEEIIKAAKKYHHDLIIMGSSGKGVLKELVFGSISNYVLQNSNIPVMIVKETSKQLGTRIDKNLPKSNYSKKPGRHGSGIPLSVMKKRAGIN
ncbi:MAG: universal stress protein [Nitrosopumilus sp.]|nr:universal stress protein [Nitrosopumilus sp.]